MSTRSPGSQVSLTRRAAAQRRIRRTAAFRPLCSTNGCATYLDVDPVGRTASCPICGYHRAVAAGSPALAGFLAPALAGA